MGWSFGRGILDHTIHFAVGGSVQKIEAAGKAGTPLGFAPIEVVHVILCKPEAAPCIFALHALQPSVLA